MIMAKLENMKKMLILTVIIILIFNCANATSDSIEINGINFEIPDRYHGGELGDEMYQLDNIFSIRCIDDDVGGAIGLWAVENDSSEDMNIDNHPIRHFIQYNTHVGGNHSHAYFASGDSIYEIAWAGKEINKDIERLIKNTPESEMDNNTFYSTLDEETNIYKQQKIDELNQDAEYNYLEAKFHSQPFQDRSDNSRIKEILLTSYN